MSAIFEDALYLSFVISIFILLLLGFSKMTESKYTPKWRYWTWLFVSLRLAVPFVPEHTINLSHLLPELTPLSYDTEYLTEGSIIAAQTHSLPESNENVISTLLPIQSLNAMEIVVTVWIIGVICFICYHLIGYILFRKKMRRWSEKLIDINLISIFQDMMNEMKIHRKIDLVINKNVTSPMIIGFFKVTLMLPDQVYEAADLFPILKHELVHVKRRDAWYKLILIYINALYWFNPITYLMVYVANRDLEICCDDDVVSGKPIEFREMYSKTILSAAQQKEYSFYPSNFNGGIQMVKMRLKNILNMKPRKKGIFVLILVALALCILGTKITATNAAAKSFTWNTSENITVIDKSLKNSTLKDYKYYETLSLNFSAKDGYKRVEQYCTNVLGNINDSNSLLYVNPSSENQADIAYVINQSDKSEYSISEVNFSDAENIVISHVGSFTPLSTSSIDACLKAMTAKKDRILAIANSFNIDLSSYYEVSPGYSPEFNQYNLYSLRGEINIEQGGTTPAFFLNKEHSEGIILLSDAQGKEYLYNFAIAFDNKASITAHKVQSP
ncbi:hypothetical protein A7X67_03520 [Clostridium sp. W14A]|nr:hypothetical protein A7X67_03520 [Clostridium sp. W14A]